ncbi:MAG: hypothetical protein KKF12_16740 [Proteobacteria bacterium]|nr:hypothetical protein [Desulfobacula sp.]MBU3954601.1 hypothetical protein [Pseudomonadota bacterium]MBU4132464.1 hypothetical protein [Pseudomonadota bacterium]
MPKPAELEKLQGNPGHRPVNPNLPVADTAIPGPPKYLGRIAARAYNDLVGLVGTDGMRVMAKSDRLALILICDAWEEYRQCKEEIEDVGQYWLLPREA